MGCVTVLAVRYEKYILYLFIAYLRENVCNRLGNKGRKLILDFSSRKTIKDDFNFYTNKKNK